jgi:5'-nucleotidase
VSSSTGESLLADLVADALREAGQTQVGIHNTGGIRARIDKGPITWGEVFEALPFQNTLITMRLTGSQLKKVLGTRVHAISGVRVHFSSGPGGPRLVSATLADGSPIEETQSYTVTTNDFLFAGGDGVLDLAKGTNVRETGLLLRDVFVTYLQKHRPLAPRLDGRVRVD